MGQWPLMFINDESSVEIIFILTIVLVTNSKTTNFHTQQYEKKKSIYYYNVHKQLLSQLIYIKFIRCSRRQC